jgi:hypothetical protein
MSGTVIPNISGPQFAARIADLFPRGWASSDAMQAGNVYALLLSIGNGLSFVESEVQYAALAQRMQTETFPELDMASVDYLANRLPRPAGATDSQFAKAIIAELFKPASTRSALYNALLALTGYAPRMLEPWNVCDTGAWRATSYWNVDTVANPARWGNGGLRYQGYIETAPPSIPTIGAGNPILTWGTAYWGSPGYFFGIIPDVDEAAVDDLVNRLHAYGTTVWLKLVNPPSAALTVVAPGPVGALTATATGTDRVLLSWHVPTSGTPPFTFYSFYRQSGTTSFNNGPSATTTSVTILNLSADISYDFRVTASNTAGSAQSQVVSATTNLIPPSPATNLTANQVQATAVTLSWSPPATGSGPFTYTILYRVTGTGTAGWQSFPVSAGATGVTVLNLTPQTSYDFEVQSANV